MADNFRDWFAGSCIVDDVGTPRLIFHGTNQPVDSFESERLGASTSSVSSKLGFWFSDSMIVAEDYANKAARHVIADVVEHEAKLERLLKESEAAERRGNWARVDELTHEIEAHDIPPTREAPTGQNIVPVYLVIRNPLIVDAAGKSHGTGEGAEYIKQALTAGHDGVIFLNTADSDSNTVSNHYVVFSSSQVKSAISNSGLFDRNASDISDCQPLKLSPDARPGSPTRRRTATA
ncbi:hypothetical protein [Roseateles asaccharophilus]|uniref:ADP-ribosyltransferase-containing protein n=1 Tax=Roseateles asaccharophilus TaxID=582607 RepID=UPI00384FDECC